MPVPKSRAPSTAVGRIRALFRLKIFLILYVHPLVSVKYIRDVAHASLASPSPEFSDVFPIEHRLLIPLSPPSPRSPAHNRQPSAPGPHQSALCVHGFHHYRNLMVMGNLLCGHGKISNNLGNTSCTRGTVFLEVYLGCEGQP